MHEARRVGRRAALALGVFCVASACFGCGSPTVFEGRTPILVAGDPPPPPPPPPPPSPKVEEPPPRVEVRDNKIEIREKIQFEYNKATIKEESFSLLNEIADVIRKNPHIKKIAIEGHASAEGNPKHNLKLSDERAKAVMQYLTEHGISQETLTARGFGSTKPVADNETEEGREQNRRVEFNIIEQDVTKSKVQIDAKTGAEKVLEKEQTQIRLEPLPTTPAPDAGPEREPAKPAQSADAGTAPAEKATGQ